MKYSPLSLLATLLISSGVSGFAPFMPPHHVATVTSRLDASVSPVTPATEPSIFFQSRIAEPHDVESVPAAAYFLSSKFPKEPFVVQYSSTTPTYNTAKGGENKRRPVLDLSVLKDIKTDDDDTSIRIDAGVTVNKVAKVLSKLKEDTNLKTLFLALPANCELSVVEAALDERYDKLRNTIKEFHVVDKDGNIITKQLEEINESEDVIINIVLSPSPEKESSKGTVLGRWYTRSPTAPDEIMEGSVSDLPSAAKVMVFKYGMFNTVFPQVLVFVEGDLELDLPTDEWDEIPVTTLEQYWRLQNDLSKAASLEVLTSTGVLDSDTSKNITFEQILDVFRIREEHLLVTIENGTIRASFDARHPPNVDPKIKELFKFDNNDTPRAIAFAARETPALSKRVAKVMPTSVINGTVIKGFKGEIYDGVRGQMQNKRFQYATSSYDNMMNPAIIVYPEDEEDVALAIKYATLPEYADARKTKSRPSGRPLKVMGRGGGHQYCGVSCDNGALIISMDNFKKLEPKDVYLEGVTGPDGQPQTVTKEVHVGTGILLKEWAEFANKNGFTIPHGECPTVGIGGHSQTGGFGHILRNFGLAIDYIYGFTIVTANGEVRTVTRDSQDQTDKDLYWAVLGGSPGAFGVTTNLIFHPILDKDYPNSTGFSATARHTPSRMKAVLSILEEFINRAKDSDDDGLVEGIDLMCSLSSHNDNSKISSVLPITPSIIIFELECRDMTDPKAKEQMDYFIKRFNDEVVSSRLERSIFNLVMGNQLDGKSHYPLSEMSLYFTRKPPAVTNNEKRENRRPYRKATYGSNEKVKPGWSEAFAKLLNDVAATKEDISCVFQVGVGGGAQARLGKAKLNSIAHRDAQLSSIVFDLFRGEDDESIIAADAFGKRFEIDIVNGYQTAYPKVMSQWASHGDLDMDKEEVWEKYFDKPETYHKLRRIKKDVDPDDVFHSRFTIRPEVN